VLVPVLEVTVAIGNNGEATARVSILVVDSVVKYLILYTVLSQATV
jgi:hypothetical protein